MKVITAVESYVPSEKDICVFLAGGITNCPNWQNEVIEELFKGNNLFNDYISSDINKIISRLE